MQLSSRPSKHSSRAHRMLSQRKVDDTQKTTVLPVIELKATQQINSTLIAEAERRIYMSQQSLASDNKAHIRLDGGYGDYAMGVFRVKDRKKWVRESIPKLFDNSFKAKILSCFTAMDEAQLEEKIKIGQAAKPPKVIQPKPIVEKKPKTPLSPSKIQEIEDNMNGYLEIKYFPQHQQLKTVNSSFISINEQKSQQQIESNPPDTIRPRQSSRFKDKGFMFKYLSKLSQQTQTS